MVEEEIFSVPDEDRPVQFCIQMKELKIYEVAGGQTGYKVSVTAQEGDEIMVRRGGDVHDEEVKMSKIESGYVQITIIPPADQPKEVGYLPFWAAYEKLEEYNVLFRLSQ